MWGSFVYPKYRLFVIGFTAVLAVLLWWVLEGTRLGSAVRAGSESTEMVSLLGLNVLRIFSLVFALGAATAALAGVLAAPIRGAEPFMGIEALGVAFVIVVVGGLGSFGGALVGAPAHRHRAERDEHAVARRCSPHDLRGHGCRAAAAPPRPAGPQRMNTMNMSRHSHFLLALAIVVAMPLCMQSGSLASEVLIFGLAAMGCNLLLGYTGLLSFGQGIFFGLGSYTIALLLTR